MVLWFRNKRHIQLTVCDEIVLSHVTALLNAGEREEEDLRSQKGSGSSMQGWPEVRNADPRTGGGHKVEVLVRVLI